MRERSVPRRVHQDFDKFVHEEQKCKKLNYPSITRQLLDEIREARELKRSKVIRRADMEFKL